MLAYILRRLAIGVLLLFLATIGVFLLVHFSGNPLSLLRQRTPPPPKSVILQRENLLHLNRPLVDQYWIWFSNAIHGNFGSTVAGLPVGQQLTLHLNVTLRMVILATVLAICVAVPLGVWSAVRKGKPADHTINVSNFLFLSIPTFVIGTLLKEFVAIPINQAANKTIFYTIGQQSPLLSGPFLSRIPDYAAHTVLPVLTLILVSYPSWAIYQRASVLDALDSDYVRLARAKGISPRRVLIRHVLRNALIPVTTVVALDFAAVIGGAVVTETIFSWDGMGQWFVQGVEGLDINIVLAFLLVTATAIILFNLVADILYAFLDPRIRYD
ncbi:MAG: ABC transporter permease [Acidimicrobiales bacterium]|jgi:peptide/nickel transport system permease protein